ncbi:endonuclease MutS2 [Peribacillus sp. SCS-155]|uniref:endonuclease MutS2 n=1 Tax=Peribacillus sedimenti TaxID=3115297 RepID=UPI0039064034
MNQKALHTLQFTKIKEIIGSFSLTETGRQRILAIEPSINPGQIQALQSELDEAVLLLKKSASVPLSALEGIESILQLLNKGVALRPEHFMRLHQFLDSCIKIKRYMKDKEYIAPRVTSYVHSISSLPDLSAEIHRCIRNGIIDDNASRELGKIRKQIAIHKERLKGKLENLIKSPKIKSMLQETIISERSGRYVIPLKKEFKGKIKGAILDSSASGSTIFVEPEESAALQAEIDILAWQEEAEGERILSYLTGLVETHQQELKLAVETMVHYDVLFSKAKYSISINGRAPKVNTSHFISIKGARHPLLENGAVPLNVELGNGEHALVITGPNTGGKTVAIKTIGLITLMAQSGFHIPVEEGTHIAIFQNIWVDIGDGQSIEQNLSTFSSHIKNIITILEETNDRSLVLLDELGSGTDPAEGMGLATVILEQLYKKGATLLATTHYSEIKHFADITPGFLNGSMEFDLETLRPTYKLIIGKGGDSQGFSIALKLGMHPGLIEKAHKITYKEERSYPIRIEGQQQKLKLDKQITINRYMSREGGKIAKGESEIHFTQGDNVKLSPNNETGIIFKGPDDYGNYEVLVKGEMRKVNTKRLSLYIAAADLYPKDYDMAQIFDSKENRKKSKLMNKRHVEGLTIEHE